MPVIPCTSLTGILMHTVSLFFSLQTKFEFIVSLSYSFLAFISLGRFPILQSFRLLHFRCFFGGTVGYELRARICKRLRSQGIDSEESIPGLLQSLQIRALLFFDDVVQMWGISCTDCRGEYPRQVGLLYRGMQDSCR